MSKGFSLIESLIAITIAISVGVVAFQLFRQNERMVRDQELLAEMQQSARAAGFQIAEDIRLAGQGVPIFASSFDQTPDEATAAFLNGSTSLRANIRAGLSNAESQAVSPFPIQLLSGVPTTLTIQNAASFTNGRGYVYLSGPVNGEIWGWARASLDMTSAATNSIVVTPLRAAQFAQPLLVSLEEAIAIYYDPTTGAIRRTTATDLTDPTNPTWAPANELAANVTALTFAYFDRIGQSITPNTLANRSAIARVEVDLTVQAAGILTNGVRPSFSVHLRPVPRNLSSR